MNYYLLILKKSFNNTLFVTFIFFILFYLVLHLRGEGWDGDSIVNIAQFYKIINFDLYGTPDAGTTPKFLPIFIFGLFNYLFDSYAIHWPVILISSYAFAKTTKLPIDQGGGFIWFFLPFSSPALVYSIVSADNPGLAISFYILAIVFFFEKKILVSFIFLLLAEFTRPGYSILMIITFLYFIFIEPTALSKNKKKNLFIFILILIGLLHSLYCYKLAYPTFESYNANNWETYRPGFHEDPEFFINNKLFTLKIFFSGVLAALFSNNLLPFPFSIIALMMLIFSFKSLKNYSTILFLQPAIYGPFLFAALTLGTIMPAYRNPYFFKNLYAHDPYYFLTTLPVLLFGISFFISKLISINNTFFKNKNNSIFNSSFLFLSKKLSILYNFKTSIILAFILVLGNGIVLKGKYELNPIQSNKIKSKYSDVWLSDKLAKKIILKKFNKKKEKLKILSTCDVIPIIVDNGLYIKKISFASPHIYLNKKKVEYIGSCYDSHFLKRSDDILLNIDKKYDLSDNFDILYTTKDMIKYFKIDNYFELVELKMNRIIIINKKNN